MEKIWICDSTLRDGEQSPDAGMTYDQKIKLGQALMDLGVDVLDVGLARTSEMDAKVIYRLSQIAQNQNTIISALARCCKEDIDMTAKVLQPAIQCKKGRLHVFVATSQNHIEAKLRKTKPQILQMVHDSVLYAKNFTSDIQFSAEDATRSDMNFLIQCIQTAINAGAKTINLADTVGQMVDTQMQEFFEAILSKLKYDKNVVFSAHCHDDKGFATSNSLFAIKGGARQVECCMNGLGERAGNAALEEIVMAILTTPERYPYITQIDPKKIMSVSQMVSDYSGFVVAPNKAIIGKNAFLHASGIHQDGILKARQKGIKVMYSSIDPEILGRKDEFMITRHSGHKAIGYMLEKQKIDIIPQEAKIILEQIKNQSDHPKHFSNKELIDLYQKHIQKKKNS